MSPNSTDITAIYCTAERIGKYFANNVRHELLKALGDIPLISVSKQPLNFGVNIVDDGKPSILNYYKVLLRACKLATTPYIAVCEDDTLYPDEHFRYRPPLDTFAYNFNRWNIYTWSKPPFFSLRQRKILAGMIAPRELFIETIEDKFRADPEGKRIEWWGEPGRNYYENKLGVTPRKSEEFLTYNPLVVFSHENSFCYDSNGKNKMASKIRALEIPYHGTAEEVIKLYEV